MRFSRKPFSRIGGHVIDQQLTHGSLGPRFRTVRNDGSHLAIELVSIRSDEELFERCLGQLTAMAGLTHPNLVPVLEAGIDRDHLYVITPEPEETADHLGAIGLDAAPIVSAVGAGLAYLHDAGVLHRDLQLRHIGCYDTVVRLGGFALAEVPHLGRTNGVGPIGGVNTMAPSIVRGASATTGSDVYSLGAALHLLATGVAVHPDANESLARRICRIGADAPVIDSSLPQSLTAAAQTALDSDGTNARVPEFLSQIPSTSQERDHSHV